MFELLIIPVLAVHLVTLNLASAGPMVCLWLRRRKHPDYELRDRVGQRLAWWSVWAFVVGMLLGGAITATRQSSLSSGAQPISSPGVLECRGGAGLFVGLLDLLCGPMESYSKAACLAWTVGDVIGYQLALPLSAADGHVGEARKKCRVGQ